MSRVKALLEEKYKIFVYIFFALFIFIGISAFKDYGISWDEKRSRSNGLMALRYVVWGDRGLSSYTDRDYGSIFEIFLVVVEKSFNLTHNPKAVYLMRHLVTFLLFYLAVCFFYLLCKDRFQSWKIGLLGSLFLILSPRIFAHSFYNSKDIACLSLFIISIYTLIAYLNNKTFFRALFHALTSAFLIDIRITGIMVPLLTIIFFIADKLMINSDKIHIKRAIFSLLIYIFSLTFFIVLFWPTLWTNPFFNFINALNSMAHFRWNHYVLYLGNYFKGSELPWHYIPVWIAISTPLSYVVCFFIGCLVSIWLFLNNPIYLCFSKKRDLIFISWFFLPLLAIIIFKPVLYDEWRHMFFIYPAFITISLIGLVTLFKLIKMKFQGITYKIINAALILLISLNLINVVKFMVKYHPYQNIYFNILAGKNMEQIRNNFELDYWGLSYRKALEYILENDTDEVIKIYVEEYSGYLNANILDPNDRKRIVYVKNINEAKYFLRNCTGRRKELLYKKEFYSIKIDSVKIMVVYIL